MSEVILGRPVRAALAATAAWLAVLPMTGLADQYPFYAPMGALAAVTGTVVASLRESVQTVISMAIGALLALAVTPLPVPAGILIVAGLATFVGRWPRLGDAGHWTPITAVFVLIIGGDEPLVYTTAYIGLFTFGAIIGCLFTMIAAPLPLRDVDRALDRMRESLADQLESLADGLGADVPPTPGEWTERQHDLEPVVGEMHELLSHAAAARRVNWRAVRWRETAARQYREARMLSQLTSFVDDITDLLVSHENREREQVALGPRLRPQTAAALTSAAKVLRDLEEDEPDPEVQRHAWESFDTLVEAMRSTRRETGDDLLSASSVVTALRRFMLAAEMSTRESAEATSA